MKGRAILYSPEELAWIEARREMPRGLLALAFSVTFNRSEIGHDQIKSLCSRKGWKTGRTGQFEPGQSPPNKGQRCPEGKGGRHPNSRRTQFKPGVRQGVAVRLYKPIGSERTSKEGFLERKINDDFPPQRRWRGVHLIRWEELNGPVPQKHCLKCLDSNRLNTDPSNWMCIERAVLVRLNGTRYRPAPVRFDDAAEEIKPALLLAAKLKSAKGKAKRKASA